MWSRIGIGALVLIVLALGANAAVDAFRITTVLTGSMEPTIMAGDLVITQNDTLRPPAQGDIVMYEAKQLDGTVVARFAHRIIGKASDGWVVQGDANPNPDVQHPSGDEVLGVVVARIPGMGSLQTSFLPWGLGFGVMTTIGLYLFVNRRN